MDPADLMILAVIACLDGIILVCLRRRHRRLQQEQRLARMLRRGIEQLARA